MRPSSALPMSIFVATASVAMTGAAMEPPPIPAKDLSFGDGWTFQSRGNNCTATRALDKTVTLALRFTNFHDGSVFLTGKLPPFGDADADAEAARHEKGAGSADVGDGNYVDRLDDGITYDNFPGTAIFVDGALAARFVFGETDAGVTTYRIGHVQDDVRAKLVDGKMMRIKILGREAFALPLDASPGLWAEMDKCVDQYPDG